MARLFFTATIALAALVARASASTPRLRTAQFNARHLQEQCVTDLDWTSEGGEILVNGQPFHLKGTSWFGFEVGMWYPHWRGHLCNG